MYAYREYIINGECPYCKRDLSLVISSLNQKKEIHCVDCLANLTVIPNTMMYAEIFDSAMRRAVADITPYGKDCCGV